MEADTDGPTAPDPWSVVERDGAMRFEHSSLPLYVSESITEGQHLLTVFQRVTVCGFKTDLPVFGTVVDDPVDPKRAEFLEEVDADPEMVDTIYAVETSEGDTVDVIVVYSSEISDPGTVESLREIFESYFEKADDIKGSIPPGTLDLPVYESEDDVDELTIDVFPRPMTAIERVGSGDA